MCSLYNRKGREKRDNEEMRGRGNEVTRGRGEKGTRLQGRGDWF